MSNELVPRNTNDLVSTIGSGLSKFIQNPGDTLTQEMKPGGDIVTKLDAQQGKVTHRQYMKKDGTPGKQIITIMQPDKSE